MTLATYTSGGTAATSYNITIDFVGASWSADLQSAFVAAADYISSIILSDVADIWANINDGQGFRNFDDLEITAEIAAIDGVGGTLGYAGPTHYRTTEFIPFAGEMTFDDADAQRLYDADITNGTSKWYDTVLHEMIHVLGFGTMWNLQGLLTNYGTADTPDYRYTGALATAEYAAEFPDVYAADPDASLGIPVESDTGLAGTDGGHWDEARFGSELMTGFINTTNTLSNMSLASLADLGYDVAYAQSAPLCFCEDTLIETANGPVAVQDLRAGDQVMTADHGLKPLRFSVLTRYSFDDIAHNPKRCPIRMRTGAFGTAAQTQDLWVSPQHRMVMTSPTMTRLIGQPSVLIAAKDLLDLPKVHQRIPKKGVTYFHLLFDDHVLVQAHGIWSESLYVRGTPPARAFVQGPAARCLVRKLRKAFKQHPFDMNGQNKIHPQNALTA